MSNTTKQEITTNWREMIRSIFMSDLKKSYTMEDIKRLMKKKYGKFPKGIAPIVHALKESEYLDQIEGVWHPGRKLLRQCTRRPEFEVQWRLTEEAALKLKDQMWSNGFSVFYHGWCEFHQGYELRYRPKEATKSK